MEIYRRLALLTDEKALLALNRVIGGLLPANPNLGHPAELKAIVSAVATQSHSKIEPQIDDAINDLSGAVRLLLAEFAEDDELRPRLSAALDMDRPVLVEPVTAALVLAGIVVLLQTRVSLKVKSKDGKTSVDLNLEKKPTADGIIKKFFNFFG